MEEVMEVMLKQTEHFGLLEKHVGGISARYYVTVSCVERGEPYNIKSVPLMGVEPFSYITVKKGFRELQRIPFIGKIGIQKITAEIKEGGETKDLVVYENKKIQGTYNPKDNASIEEIIAESWGDGIAKRLELKEYGSVFSSELNRYQELGKKGIISKHHEAWEQYVHRADTEIENIEYITHVLFARSIGYSPREARESAIKIFKVSAHSIKENNAKIDDLTQK